MMSEDKLAPGLPTGNLTDVLGKLVDHFAGPQRIKSQAEAYANAAVTSATAELQISILRAEAQARIDGIELRRQKNINAISDHARLSLPSPEAHADSNTAFSEDFAYRFFSECADIGDPQLQVLWGKLLADEVNRPGSYHPSTLSILKNITKEDTQIVEKLCQMVFIFGPAYYERMPIFFTDGNAKHISLQCGINYDNLVHLEALGVLHHNPMGGYVQDSLPSDCTVRHFDRSVRLRFAKPDNIISTGSIMFTRAGSELSRLAAVGPLPGLFEAVLEVWKTEALSVDEIVD